MESVAPYIGGWVFCLLIGAAIGSGKGKGSAGAWLGALLGPLGLLIIAIDKPSVEVQAQRDVAVEQAREKLRQEALEQARAELRAQADTPPAPYQWPTPQQSGQQPPADPWGDSPMRQRS